MTASRPEWTKNVLYIWCMKKLFTLLAILSLSSCLSTPDNEEEKIAIFDPKVPGGTSKSEPITRDVLGLTATVEHDRVLLEWASPSIYKGIGYNIHIYKVNGDGEDFELPDPQYTYNGAFLYYVRDDFETFEGEAYMDAPDDEDGYIAAGPGQTYTYFVYVEKSGIFSSGERLTVTTPTIENVVEIPPPAQFWQTFTTKYGKDPADYSGQPYLDTLSPGSPTIDKLKGQMAWAKNGMILYISDTDMNRVMIWANTLGLECYNQYTEGTIEFDLCIAINGNAPLQPYAVLGQASLDSNYSCQDGANPLGNDQCFTSPTGLLVIDDTLFIADSGNDRIAIFDSTPLYGCYGLNQLIGENPPVQCSFDRVIGKQDTADLTTYTLAGEGDASLSSPNGMAFHNNHLYIADTNNRRVVTAVNAHIPSLWDCEAGSWRTSQCVFSGVLGQPDFFTSNSFAQEYDDGNITYDFTNNRTVGDSDFLKRHFSYPIDIEITDNEELIIVANENFSRPSAYGDLTLFARVIIFNDFVLEGTFPDCTPATFNAGDCDADRAIGQPDFDRLIMTAFGGEYTDTSYAMGLSGGIDTFGNWMFLTDPSANIVNIWEDYTDTTVFAGPPTYRVYDPQGAWDTEGSRNLPDLNGLGQVEFRQENRSLMIMDAGSSHYYQIPIYNVGN